MTKELIEKYAERNFLKIADTISEDFGEYYFNNV